MLKVAKFGGTSVKDNDAIRRLKNIIESKEGKTIVVVSAFAGVTDLLVSIIENLRKGKTQKAVSLLNDIFNKHINVASELGLDDKVAVRLEKHRDEQEQLIKALDVLGEISPKSYALIVSLGELLSSYIISEYFLSQKIDAVLVDSRKIIKTDNEYIEANVDFKSTNRKINKIVKELLKKHRIIVVGGFTASDNKDNTTVLGRGGSDYSAAIIAAALKADALEIWTDVSGIMTVDPRLIADSRIIKELTYNEASELAYFGAKVLHPKTILPAIAEQIPVRVLNSYEPSHTGTKIVAKRTGKRMLKAIAVRNKITLINITSNRMLGAYGFLSRVFEVFRRNETSVDIITTSEVSISLTIDDAGKLNKIKKELKNIADVDVKKQKAIICAVGEGIRDTAGIAARFFGALKGINVDMVSIGASDVNISIVLNEKDIDSSVRLLHNEFFSGELDKTIFY